MFPVNETLTSSPWFRAYLAADFGSEINLTDGAVGPKDRMCRMIKPHADGTLRVKAADGTLREIPVFKGNPEVIQCLAIAQNNTVECTVYW